MSDSAEAHVYFVHSPVEGLVKIGYSKDPSRRLGALRSESEVPLELLGTIWFGGRRAEASYHDRFAKHREHGEWFRVEADLRQFLVETLGCPERLFGGERIWDIEDCGWLPRMEHEGWVLLPVAVRPKEREAIEEYARALDRSVCDVLRERTPRGHLETVRRIRRIARNSESVA